MTTYNGIYNQHHQMLDTEIRLIIFFAVEDREALYRQQKQGWKLMVAQTMNYLMPKKLKLNGSMKIYKTF